MPHHTYTDTPRERSSYIQPENLTAGEAIGTVLLNRISWGAVFAGLAMAFSTQLILNLLGIGIGVLTLDTAAQTTTAAADNTAFSAGAATWWVISGILAAGIGGLTAGRLAGEPKRSTAGWHGLISWAASILFLTLLMTTAAGAMTGGPFQIVMDNGSSITAEQPYSPPATPQEALNPDAPPSYAGATRTVDADTISAAALASAAALILGALAAWFGGVAGAIDRRDIPNGKRPALH